MVRKLSTEALQISPPDTLFIPGARDFSLDQQRAVLAMAAAERIGINATEQGALTPAKSKTLVVRVEKEMMPAKSGGE